jgi:hypothetical protein
MMDLRQWTFLPRSVSINLQMDVYYTRRRLSQTPLHSQVVQLVPERRDTTLPCYTTSLLLVLPPANDLRKQICW